MKKIEETLKVLREKMPRNSCYGIRMLKDDSIEMFYHPFGCEGELIESPKHLDDFINAVYKSR